MGRNVHERNCYLLHTTIKCIFVNLYAKQLYFFPSGFCTFAMNIPFTDNDVQHSRVIDPFTAAVCNFFSGYYCAAQSSSFPTILSFVFRNAAQKIIVWNWNDCIESVELPSPVGQRFTELTVLETRPIYPPQSLAFGGYEHEDFHQFRRNFRQFMMLAGVKEDTRRQIEILHAVLRGPALSFFEQKISPDIKIWTIIEFRLYLK